MDSSIERNSMILTMFLINAFLSVINFGYFFNYGLGYNLFAGVVCGGAAVGTLFYAFNL